MAKRTKAHDENDEPRDESTTPLSALAILGGFGLLAHAGDFVEHASTEREGFSDEPAALRPQDQIKPSRQFIPR